MEKIIKIKTAYKGHYSIDICEVDNGKNIFDIEVFRIGEGTCSVVYDTIKNKYIFISQFRASINDNIIELVGGGVDKGDTPEESIIKEIEEEIGYKVDKINLISDFFVAPGCSEEKNYLFYAEVSEKISNGGGIHNEDIKILEADGFNRFGEIYINESVIKLRDAKAILGCSLLSN